MTEKRRMVLREVRTRKCKSLNGVMVDLIFARPLSRNPVGIVMSLQIGWTPEEVAAALIKHGDFTLCEMLRIEENQ